MLDPDTLTKFFKIVVADLLLAGDNALVIALATRSLPAKEQFWGRIIGTGGAVALRLIFVAIVGWMLKVPYVQLVGGILLLWIAWKLVQPQADENAEGHDGKVASTLRQAVGMIIVADVTMSLDNVVAIANIAQGDMMLIAFGLLLSIPLVVWGSSFISKLMTTHRWIVWLGGAILGHVAGHIIFNDPSVLAPMGVQIQAGDNHEAIAKAMDGHPQAVWVATTVPWAFATILLFLGWFGDRKPASPTK